MKKLKNKNLVTALFLCLCVALLMTACMNSATNGNRPTAAPTLAPSVTPSATVENLTPFDWKVNADKIEKNIARISEIDEARVVVNGQTALVAVKFAPAYQGEMTDRIREMVSSEIKKADPAIRTVAVTNDQTDVGKTYDLADRLQAGEALENLKNDIEAIIRNITTRT